MNKKAILAIKVTNKQEWSDVEDYFLNKGITWACLSNDNKYDPDKDYLGQSFLTYISYIIDDLSEYIISAEKDHLYTIDGKLIERVKSFTLFIDKWDKPIFDEYIEGNKMGLL